MLMGEYGGGIDWPLNMGNPAAASSQAMPIDSSKQETGPS